MVANGCIGVDFLQVIEYDLFILDVVIVNVESFCVGDIVFVFVGQVYLNYVWSSGVIGLVVVIVEVGFYSVIVMDDWGCIVIDFI